jgi:hypothetical protein
MKNNNFDAWVVIVWAIVRLCDGGFVCWMFLLCFSLKADVVFKVVLLSGGRGRGHASSGRHALFLGCTAIFSAGVVLTRLMRSCNSAEGVFVQWMWLAPALQSLA